MYRMRLNLVYNSYYCYCTFHLCIQIQRKVQYINEVWSRNMKFDAIQFYRWNWIIINFWVNLPQAPWLPTVFSVSLFSSRVVRHQILYCIADEDRSSRTAAIIVVFCTSHSTHHSQTGTSGTVCCINKQGNNQERNCSRVCVSLPKKLKDFLWLYEAVAFKLKCQMFGNFFYQASVLIIMESAWLYFFIYVWS